jgi:hypothetical protein
MLSLADEPTLSMTHAVEMQKKHEFPAKTEIPLFARFVIFFIPSYAPSHTSARLGCVMSSLPRHLSRKEFI